MQLYPGIAPPPPPPTPNGYGVWPTPDCATGGDDRSAQNLMTAVQGVTNRSNWLWWRTLDHVSGGVYTFTATITLKNTYVWNGGTVRITGAGRLILDSVGHVWDGGILYVGDETGTGAGHHAPGNICAVYGGAVWATHNSDIYASGAGSTVSVINGAELTNDAVSPFNQRGPHTKIGPKAYTAPRFHVVNNSSGAVTVPNAHEYDVLYCSYCSFSDGTPNGTIPGSGASSVVDNPITLDPPPDDFPEGVTVRVCFPAHRVNLGTVATNCWIEVQSTHGGGVGFGRVAGGTGSVYSPCCVDLVCRSDSGSAARAWVAVNAS